jgi:hypothetical protein
MSSSANIDDVKALHISGPVIMTIPPGRDPQPVPGQVWLLTRPKMITGWRRESGRG